MRNSVRYAGLAFAGLALASALGSCGKAASEPKLWLDSNTNWLMRCDSDEACSGSLRCYCGSCTKPCAQNAECSLLASAECAASGDALCGAQASAGGLCVLGCIEDAECGLDFTCTAGQCVPKPCTGGYQSWDDVFQRVAIDLARLDADDALSTRYFSLANRWSYGACSRSLNANRQGLSKLVNSLSDATVITVPAAIDADETLYRIDLRDYGWDRPVAIAGVEYADVWEALVGNDPYAVPFAGDDADDAVADSGARVPVMFASSFIATATRSDVYYALANVPERLAALLTSLGLDPEASASSTSFQAGFTDEDGTEFQARQWQLQVRAGYLWQIADFGAAAGGLFQTPLADPQGQRELIYTLPNGLHGFAFMDPLGVRMEGWQATLDANENDFVARVPRANLRRHSPGLAVRDEVRDVVLQNPGAYAAGVAQVIQQRYPGPEALVLLLSRDDEAFTRPALEAARVDVRLPDPITQSFAEFDRDVALEDAAGDLMLTREELRDNLALVDPALGPLDGGYIDRDDFSGLYVEALCVLSVVLENQPDPSVCP